ncbi:SpoIIE family protein phosphatase [Streptomyces sp. APSN-46.1]|uniref:SpoIIE family protein phosphatase n=1 Tax=Streptomyces sp. APSN-46.1 TaxID=2929049 RepID=UPI001FB384AA|nr:SpoIIE family protein phosphatase [Streptomyces sp. APSN-46.1]MCJ1676385.1 SpoIIE family protein phosphatase [Streptomyces sp. APSN-46.1]
MSEIPGFDEPQGPLDVSRAAMAVLDGEGRVVGWSPAAAELLGYEASEVLGREFADLVTDAAAPELLPGLRSVLRLRHRNGQSTRVAVAIRTLSSCGEEPGGDGGSDLSVGVGTRPAHLLAMADANKTEQWNALQSMLRGLATQSPVGLAIYDTRLRVVWTNAALYAEMGPADYAGVGPDDMVTHGVIVSPGMPDTLEEVMSDVLTTGEPVIELHYRGRPPSAPDRDHVWSCSYYRLEDPAGSPLGVCEESVDITERYLAQQRLDLLVRAGRSVGTTLDMSRTAREFAAVTTPWFADAVTVDLLETVLHSDRSHPDAVPDTGMVRVWPPGEPPAAHSIAYLVSADVRARAAVRPAREPGLLTVPLRTEGTDLGIVSFAWEHRTNPLDDGERAVADELVARLAVCVDNARRYARDHAAALLLQRSLLPRLLPRLSAVELAYRYLPADSGAGVGGDWFDVIALSGTRVGLVVGDVVGHGLGAAATMGRLRTSVRVLARMDLAPDELLARLDDLVTQSADERAAVRIEGIEGEELLEDEALGVTCLYAAYDPVSGTCTMARAGHPLPAVVDPADGTVTYPELPSGPPLGLGGLPFESAELTLPPGSLLALFTDGLVHARDRDLDEQLDVLSGVLTRSTRPLDDLCDEAVGALLPGPADDDAALLLVRTRILDRHQVAVWDVSSDPQAVGRARAAASAQLRAWGLDDLVFTTELVVSELVTNAIRYAAVGPFQLRLIRDQTLICEVSDGGHTSPHLRHAAGDDEGGRGLFIVAQTTQQWGTRYTATGKIIWAEQALPSAKRPTNEGHVG